jgi:phospholipase A-2-activating protein
MGILLQQVMMEKKGPSSEELAKAPKWEERGLEKNLGKSESQVMVFNKDGSMIAAQWISGSWVIIGEVTGSGDGGYIGSDYFDHVMPVEIETPQGVRNLKLGHNNGENPFNAAQRFIDQNQLGQNYLSEIADWITARSGQTVPTIENSNAPQPASTDVGILYPTPAASRNSFDSKATYYIFFDEIPVKDKLLAKIIEFNSSFEYFALSSPDIDQISNLLQV